MAAKMSSKEGLAILEAKFVWMSVSCSITVQQILIVSGTSGTLVVVRAHQG